MGTLTPAVEQWQQALADVSDQPLQAQLLLRIGRTYVDQQAWSQAIPVLRQLWDGFPAFPDRLVVGPCRVRLHYLLGESYAAMGTLTPAMEQWQRLPWLQRGVAEYTSRGEPLRVGLGRSPATPLRRRAAAMGDVAQEGATIPPGD